MSTRHQIRELALQALYQYDLRGVQDVTQIELSVKDSPHPPAVQEQAIELAKLAWSSHKRADEIAAELAPAWPTHRQPVVDRSILRLCYYELASGMTPTAVAIDEAVELAKSFGSERSPAFINGVLDQVAKRLQASPPTDTQKPPLPTSCQKDDWLKDATDNARPLS